MSLPPAPTNVSTLIERDDDEYVVNGRKWWSTGAMNHNARILIVMGKTDPGEDRHRQQSMILVPRDTPRPGDQTRHDSVRVRRQRARRARRAGVPRRQGAHEQPDRERWPGFRHCAGTTGSRPDSPLHALDRCGRARDGAGNHPGQAGDGHEQAGCRSSRGRPRSSSCASAPIPCGVRDAHHRAGVVRQWIAESRVRIEQLRLLLMLKTAWLMDTVGKHGSPH